MRSKTFSIVGILALAAATSANPNFPQPYNGATNPNNLYSNANFMNKFVTALSSTNAKCNDIPSVGQPVLAIKQYLKIVDNILDAKNRDTYAKIIFFKETKTAARPATNGAPSAKPATFVTVKLVAQIKVNNEDYFVGVRANFKSNRKTPFTIEAYIVDTNIGNVGLVISEQNLDPTAIVGCGDVKEIYTNFIRFQAQRRIPQQYNIPYGNSQLPLIPQQLQAYPFATRIGIAQ